MDQRKTPTPNRKFWPSGNARAVKFITKSNTKFADGVKVQILTKLRLIQTQFLKIKCKDWPSKNLRIKSQKMISLRLGYAESATTKMKCTLLTAVNVISVKLIMTENFFCRSTSRTNRRISNKSSQTSAISVAQKKIWWVNLPAVNAFRRFQFLRRKNALCVE